jgi:fatty-acyl-CoA synthase
MIAKMGNIGAGLAHRPADTSVPLLEGTLGEVLRRSATRFPERHAIAWSQGEGIATLTYAQFLAEAERLASWLLAHANPGDRIAPWSRNSVEWALLEFGCALAGMVVAAWNPGWTDFECQHARDLTEPALVLAGHDTRGIPLIDRARIIAGAGHVVPLEDLRALAAAIAPCALPSPAPSDLFLIQFTSGTTGRAKGAALSHRSVVNGAWLRAAASGADETDVWVNPSPLNHMGGAVTMLPGAICVGGCYVVMNRFDAGEYLRLMRLAGATRIGGVPTMLLALLEHPDWRPGSVKLRVVGAGGAQVPQTLVERLMREFEAPVLVSYAQSECPIITSSTPGDPPKLLAETVGRCAPHVEIKVIDPQGSATRRTGETGEICVRGPVVMQGYYRAPGASSAVIDAEGFLHTGDLGSLDADGYVRVQGRSRDVIIRGGENIYPAEVEDVLLLHPDIVQAAVVGAPDARWGQQVCAAIQFREGSVLSDETLEAHAAARLAHFKIPRRWLSVEAFPLTSNGKIAKVDVEKLFLEPIAARQKGDA